MTQIPVSDIQELCKNNPKLKQKKLDNQIRGLRRMKQFYEDKAPVAPETQSIMFKNFAIALGYAIEVINRHHKLTIRLSELAEEFDDETRPSS